MQIYSIFLLFSKDELNAIRMDMYAECSIQKILKNMSTKTAIRGPLVILAFAIISAFHYDPGDDVIELTLKGSDIRQVIHGFGASDAWSCQFVGSNWPLEKREQIADWLFSTGKDHHGNPDGIGLSMWRFNIGGGSAYQGEDSEISDEWRRADSFMTGKDSFDGDRQQGQRWFLRAASERGVSLFTGFVNSPPVFLTKNGKGFSSDGSSYNLPPENYGLFAEYLANVVKTIDKNDGIRFSYISPFNEPQWDWTNKTQEGTPAQNSEIAEVTRIINRTFSDRGITSKLEIPETAQFEYLYEDHNRPGRGSQISAFFDPSSPHYLGNLSHVAPKVAAHSYFTTWPPDRQAGIRQEVAAAVSANPRPVELWMTEYCVLENNPVIKGNGRDLGMNTALYVARVIWSDLVVANAASWQWWLGVSPYDYKDGLVYTDYDKHDGNIYDSKLLWVMGNFSRFVRPGMKRVELSRNDGLSTAEMMEDIMATAFIMPGTPGTTTVIINYGNRERVVRIVPEDLPETGTLSCYLTNGSQGNNLSCQGEYAPGENLIIPPRSVVTVTNMP